MQVLRRRAEFGNWLIAASSMGASSKGASNSSHARNMQGELQTINRYVGNSVGLRLEDLPNGITQRVGRILRSFLRSDYGQEICCTPPCDTIPANVTLA